MLLDIYEPDSASFNGHSAGNSIHLSPLKERGRVLFIEQLKVSIVTLFCILKL